MLLLFIVVNVFANSTIRVITTYKWEPFNIVINDRLEGIGIDFWKYVAKKADIKYEFVIVDRWSDVLEKIKKSKAALTPSTDKTEDRKSYAVFSKPYVTYPLVLATKNNIGFIFDINYLKDKKIAVGRNFTAAKMMYEKYPYLNYVYVNSTDEALQKVKKGEVFAAVDILPVIAYKINKYEFKDLKISGQVPIYFKVRFMLSKKYAYLLPEINAIIDKIPYGEKEKIYQKYIRPEAKISFTFNEIIFYFLIFISFMIIVLLWLYSLRYEIRDLKRTQRSCYTQTDKLTGILNKKALLRTIEQKIKNKERFSLVMFDIRGFKNINKFYGHHFGDITLLELVSSVKSLLNSSETFGRVGGGTFVVIINETEKNACKRAKEIYDFINKFDFSIVKKIQCTFVVKTVYDTDEDVQEVVFKLENELKKTKKNNQLFRC